MMTGTLCNSFGQIYKLNNFRYYTEMSVKLYLLNLIQQVGCKPDKRVIDDKEISAEVKNEPEWCHRRHWCPRTGAPRGRCQGGQAQEAMVPQEAVVQHVIMGNHMHLHHLHMLPIHQHMHPHHQHTHLPPICTYITNICTPFT